MRRTDQESSARWHRLVSFDALEKPVKHCFHLGRQRFEVLVQEIFSFLITHLMISVFPCELARMCLQRLVSQLFQSFAEESIFQLCSDLAEFGHFGNCSLSLSCLCRFTWKKWSDEFPIGGKCFTNRCLVRLFLLVLVRIEKWRFKERLLCVRFRFCSASILDCLHMAPSL